MNILVCDDDKEIVDAIEIYLNQEGYQVHKAYDGEQAIKMLKELKIPLIAEDTGADYGRTVVFYPETGEYVIKSVGKPQKSI